MRILFLILIFSNYCYSQTTITRPPTSDATVTGTWSGTASSRYTVLNDYPDAAGSSFITQSASGGGDITFGFSALSVPANATNINVYVEYYTQKTASQSDNLGASLKIGGTLYTPTRTNRSTSWTNETVQFSTNPATSTAWTPSTVNSITEFGVSSTDASPSINLSSIQMRVTYDLPARKVRYIN